MHIDSFDKSAIAMLVYCFTKSAEYGEYLEAKEKLVIGIKDAVERAGCPAGVGRSVASGRELR